LSGLIVEASRTPCVYCHLVASSVSSPRSASPRSFVRSAQYALIGFQKSLSMPSS
jgi:hypothetical protein